MWQQLNPVFCLNPLLSFLHLFFFAGRDLPSNSDHQVYPQDKVVPVGGNTTFCCIVEEGNEFRDLLYGSIEMNVKRLSRRSYATTAVNQNLSGPTGTNVLCRLKNKLEGSVIFVGCKLCG